MLYRVMTPRAIVRAAPDGQAAVVDVLHEGAEFEGEACDGRMVDAAAPWVRTEKGFVLWALVRPAVDFS